MKGKNSYFEKSCQLQTGTFHLPLQGLNHILPQLLTFNIPERSSGWCFRGEALFSFGGKLAEQVFRYFQELILWAQFLYLLVSSKALKSFLVTTVPMPRKKHHETNRNLLEKYGLHCMYSPFTKITYIDLPTHTPTSWELAELLSPGLQSSFRPK